MKQKDRKKVSLNREKFLAERADMDVDKEEEKEFDDSNAKRPVVKRDFYIDEVLAITDDYIHLSHVKVLGDELSRTRPRHSLRHPNRCRYESLSRPGLSRAARSFPRPALRSSSSWARSRLFDCRYAQLPKPSGGW